MNNIKSKFSEEQLLMLNVIGVTLSDDKDYSDDELMQIHDKITDYYIFNGFDKDDSPTEVAYACESLIDLFYDEFDI